MAKPSSSGWEKWFRRDKNQKLLSGDQLRRLSEHKYSVTNIGLLDPYIQPWWCWLVSKTPLWMAPNLITIIGLAVNVVTALILISYSPNAREETPRWACALCAVGLFIYQSLDAIDGKQARRTNTSTPLGELFDHGCDSISTVFVAISTCISIQLGHYPNWMFFQCFCAMTLFYCAHWQTYVSGTLRFGKVDVTEAQATIMIIQMVSAIFGSNIWTTKVPFLDGMWNLSICAVFGIGFFRLFISFCHIFVVGGVGKNGSTVAGTSVLSPVIPFGLVVVPAFIIAQKSTENVFDSHPAFYILAFGMVAAKVTNRLVVAHMTRSEMHYLDWGLLGPLLLFLNQYFNNFVPERMVLWFALIWGAFDMVRYCIQVCLEICDHLKIELFRIPYPPKGVSSTTNSTTTTSNGTTSNGGVANSSTAAMAAHNLRKSSRISKKNSR